MATLYLNVWIESVPFGTLLRPSLIHFLSVLRVHMPLSSATVITAGGLSGTSRA
ncbi:hypothetical protein ALO43_200148 [Pseudomonas tremae]|uniref:Uncharacterized protein n=1 Tax=Pseudomonas tremae TaxID=200454 RepID=A0AA40P6H3_9PSED|nr:hypothetical protein ALO43_200148 [Pseudomonas tremae]